MDVRVEFFEGDDYVTFQVRILVVMDVRVEWIANIQASAIYGQNPCCDGRTCRVGLSSKKT